MRLEASDQIGSTRDQLEPPRMLTASTQAWLLNIAYLEPALFALPGRARAGPLALSGTVPKDEYRVSVAIISAEASTATLPTAGYRFSAGEKFQPFEEVIPLGRTWRATPLNYFLCRTRGRVRADEAFRIELELPPAPPGLWGVAHVRFEPRDASGRPPLQEGRPKDSAELRRLVREQGYW